MKKSTLFKILTLFLTFLILISCSGCFNCKRPGEKFRDTAVEIQKKNKKLIDAFAPEIQGYIYEALPYAAFLNEEDSSYQGFKRCSKFFDEGGLFKVLEKTSSENVIEYWIYSDDIHNIYPVNQNIDVGNFYSVNAVNENLEPIGYIIPTEYHNEIFGLFPGFYWISFINGEYFLCLKMSISLDRRIIEGMAILFLLDFEKHEMYYVGYTKSWVEYEIEWRQFTRDEYVYFKLTKEESL